MRRFHVHVGVSDLDRSIGFYSGLFGADPTVIKADYAKWMLDDPRINFAISVRDGAVKGIEHVGVQVEDHQELTEVYARLKAANAPVLEEGATTCCYAKSEKSWIADPDGVVWEAFLTEGDSTVYGDSPDFAALASANAASTACCTPEMQQSGACPPKAEAAPAPSTSCCG